MLPSIERKLLWRELAEFQATAEVIDLTKISVVGGGSGVGGGGKKRMPRREAPEMRLREREHEEKRLRKKARDFVMRERGVGIGR